jgi:hypothetical protein
MKRNSVLNPTVCSQMFMTEISNSLCGCGTWKERKDTAPSTRGLSGCEEWGRGRPPDMKRFCGQHVPRGP